MEREEIPASRPVRLQVGNNTFPRAPTGSFPQLFSTTLSNQSETLRRPQFNKKVQNSNSNLSVRFHSAEVEFYNNKTQLWCNKATLTCNKARTKLYFDFGEPQVKLNRSLSISSVASFGSGAGIKLRRSSSSVARNENRIKFALNSSLQVEHSPNLSSNFQVALSNIGDTSNEFSRQLFAFYSEEDAKAFVRLAINKGASQHISTNLIETPTITPTTPKRASRTFDQRLPLRPISEHLLYSDDSSIEDNIDSSKMPTHISTSAKILRRKSTGSSDAPNKNGLKAIKAKSPMSSTVSVNSVEHNFQRRNSMTSRFKKSVPPQTVWYTNNDSKFIDTSTKSVNDEDYYVDQKLTSYNERLKAKKKSQNSLESDEMTSDEEGMHEGSDGSESDASPSSLASPGSYEDLIDGLSRNSDESISRRPKFGSAPSLNWRKRKQGLPNDYDNGSKRTATTTPPVVRRVQRVRTNEKLEKYKFMLINIENDPSIIDPGQLGMESEPSFFRFEFNDYPSEVFFPNNDYYAVSGSEFNDTTLELESRMPPSASGGGWIRKSSEQLTNENSGTPSRNKLPSRSKSLDSEVRCALGSRDEAETASIDSCVTLSENICNMTQTKCDDPICNDDVKMTKSKSQDLNKRLETRLISDESPEKLNSFEKQKFASHFGDNNKKDTFEQILFRTSQMTITNVESL